MINFSAATIQPSASHQVTIRMTPTAPIEYSFMGSAARSWSPQNCARWTVALLGMVLLAALWPATVYAQERSVIADVTAGYVAIADEPIGFLAIGGGVRRQLSARVGVGPEFRKAYKVIRFLRRHADTVTIFETDIVPYWLALLEWTLPVVVYVQMSDWQKKYAAYSAALLCEAIMGLESSR